MCVCDPSSTHFDPTGTETPLAMCRLLRPAQCNAQQATLALKAYFSIGELRRREFFRREEEIHKQANLEESRQSKINGFLTNAQSIDQKGTKAAA